ncbi:MULTISPECIES: hypothetical protein [Methylosinus]|uniref:Uncharacterized protein n=1 Tax=Methylosinus trichosporium (strain ATCC 35070 / NCIMB 11131 / UNIQEM 75 / OB3b) TaxID=595536 RepID=A0A2D2CUX8_METT3|nr:MULTISPECIES: hypothetical protein [Methylosinus]ATQ66480.1 hypothetical protein CQW49_00165 [Methylosinus trichosporium OB3b]OBS51990.1 hypothetical protein A8B73_13490 [Methylosinus sp. 3S-1]
MRFGYALSHAFDESWTLRHRFSANFLNGGSNNENFPFGTASAAGVLPRGVVAEHFRDALYQASAAWRATYFVNSDGLGNLMFGSPRRFMGSARVTF